MAIGQAGQGIMRGLVMQASLGFFLLSDVDQNANDDIVVILFEDILANDVMNFPALLMGRDVILKTLAVTQDLFIRMLMQVACIRRNELGK